eukprot:391493-Pleurochrysis_carterae.AAC.1
MDETANDRRNPYSVNGTPTRQAPPSPSETEDAPRHSPAISLPSLPLHELPSPHTSNGGVLPRTTAGARRGIKKLGGLLRRTKSSFD